MSVQLTQRRRNVRAYLVHRQCYANCRRLRLTARNRQALCGVGEGQARRGRVPAAALSCPGDR